MEQGDDRQAALRILEKGGYMQKLRRGETTKVMAALARRGFTHTDIRWAIETALAEPAEVDEEQY